MTNLITRKDFGIYILYLNKDLDIYNYMVTKEDFFLVNHCNNDLEKMEGILKEGNFFENENGCVLFIEKPIKWHFILTKKTLEENKDIKFTRFIFEKLRKFEEENAILQERLKIFEDSIFCLSEKLSNGVILPGYGGCVIDQSCRELRLVCSLTFYVHTRPHNNAFTGKSIEPLTRLENLEFILFENYNGFDFDLSPLANCRKLKRIIFLNCFNYQLPNFGKKIVETREDNQTIFDIMDT